jgi:hypothetical protein
MGSDLSRIEPVAEIVTDRGEKGNSDWGRRDEGGKAEG